MDRKPIFFNLRLNNLNLLSFLWLFAIALHLTSFLAVWINSNYYLNDSVIFLTIAQNLQRYKTFSQSFYEPIIPDFQRSPLYPLLLSQLPIYAVLLLQHVLVLLSSWLIQNFTYHFKKNTTFFHHLGVIFCLTPYSINLASLLMSETVYTFFLTLLGFFLLHFSFLPTWKNLLYIAFFLILASYTRASVLPFSLWIIIWIYFFSRSILKTFCFGLLFLLGLFPWIYRNYTHTNQCFFTSMSEISMHYGRIGGTLLALDTNMKNDAFLKAHADSYVSKIYPLEKIKKYPLHQITEENERIDYPLSWVYLKQQIEMPLHGIIFHLRCILQQMTGLSYGMTSYMYGIPFLALFFALVQGFFILGVYGYFIFKVVTTGNLTTWLWFGSIIFWFLIHNAAWADGRYRYPTDLWCILGILLFALQNQQQKAK